MPIYEYECNKCGETFEVIQKMSDKPLKKHQGCGGAVTKLISASGFQFKGTGWYVTDYARKGSGSSENTETATDKKTESKDTSSNGNKEGSGSKAAPEKKSKTDGAVKSGAKKE